MCSTLVAALAESLKESCCLPSSDQSGRITTLTVYGKFDYTWCLNICGKTLLRAQIRKLFFFFFFFEPTSSQAQPRGHWQRRRRPALGSGWPFSGKACLARGALLCSGGSRTKEHVGGRAAGGLELPGEPHVASAREQRERKGTLTKQSKTAYPPCFS